MGMARPELHGRQYTIYAATKADLLKWKELCPPMTLNAWILEAIERFVEEIDNPSLHHLSGRSEDINTLRRENAALKEDNQRLTARINEIEKTLKIPRITPSQLDTVEFLKKGSILKSSESVPRDYWTIVDAISGKEKRFESEPNKSDITIFKDSLGYTSIKIIQKDDASKTLLIRPSDKAGGLDITEIKIQRAKNVSSTLDELESLGLVENIGGGWKWIR
jgi:hypothetical protein